MFKRQPLDYLVDSKGGLRESAVDDLKLYLSKYDGRFFDELADTDHPNQFTPSDLLALQTLGDLTVPTAGAINLIRDSIPYEEGMITECLRKIPQGATIWDPEVDWLASDAAKKLWKLKKSESLKGVGRTKWSKLLAAKRPLLFPIYDRYVAAGLLADPKGDDWALWRGSFSSGKDTELLDACYSVRDQACGKKSSLSPLRVLDIVIWMHERNATASS